MDRLCVQFISEAHNKHAHEFFIWRVLNCSAISLAVWNPELKKLYVAVSYQTLFSVNFREGLGTRLIHCRILSFSYILLLLRTAKIGMDLWI